MTAESPGGALGERCWYMPGPQAGLGSGAAWSGSWRGSTAAGRGQAIPRGGPWARSRRSGPSKRPPHCRVKLSPGLTCQSPGCCAARQHGRPVGRPRRRRLPGCRLGRRHCRPRHRPPPSGSRQGSTRPGGPRSTCHAACREGGAWQGARQGRWQRALGGVGEAGEVWEAGVSVQAAAAGIESVPGQRQATRPGALALPP